jgi:hypothetical protein
MAEPSSSETRVLLNGLGMGASPRWHDGRLRFSNWGTNEIVAVDMPACRGARGGHRSSRAAIPSRTCTHIADVLIFSTPSSR